MILGIYSTYLTSVSCMYLPVLIPMGIGLILGSMVFMKLTKFLLDNYYAQTFYTIIGFTLGSTFVLIPNISFDITGVLFVLCMIFGFWIFKFFKK